MFSTVSSDERSWVLMHQIFPLPKNGKPSLHPTFPMPWCSAAAKLYYDKWSTGAQIGKYPRTQVVLLGSSVLIRIADWSKGSYTPQVGDLFATPMEKLRRFSTFASCFTFSPLAARGPKTIAFLHLTLQNLWVWTIGSVLGRSRLVIKV